MTAYEIIILIAALMIILSFIIGSFIAFYDAIKYYKEKQAEEQEEHPIVQKFKSDEKAVILSNEEYERLKYPWCKWQSTQDFQEYCVQGPCGIRFVEKEIAGEILCRIESDFAYYQPNDEFTKRFIFDGLKEIAKEYGVITTENINQIDNDFTGQGGGL